MAASSPDEVAGAARGGAVTFLGSASSAALGFALSLLLARLLGTSGAGVMFQVIAVFTITHSLVRLGMDTTAVWLLPRLLHDEPEQVRAALLLLLVPPLLVSLVLSTAWALAGDRLLTGSGTLALREGLDVAALMLPAAAVTSVALAATRAFGGIVAFNLVDNLTLPLLRPVGVCVAVLLGGGTTAAVAGWSLPWLVGVTASVLVLATHLRDPRLLGAHAWRPEPRLVRRTTRYAGPRTIAAVLEQGVLWLDVILVGAIAGTAAAGVYGAAARFVAAGLIVSTALRIVVAPRFSALLAQGRHSELERLYSVTAGWILLFGAPIYLVLAVFAPTVLGLLGPGFDRGSASLAVLCAGSVVVLAAGNVQSLLLMSGRSALAALNRAIVLLVNVVGNLVLVPQIGIVGAAAVWAASMLLDTLLAAWQVRAATGVGLAAGLTLRVALLVSVCFGLPLLLTAVVFGQGLGALVGGALAATLCLLGGCYRARELLHLGQLVGLGMR